jgi:hypothetical protein
MSSLCWLCLRESIIITHEAKSPGQRANANRGRKSNTAEAAATLKAIMRFLAVDLKEIHSDLPFLPDRM